MTALISNKLFAAIHVVGIAALLAMLAHGRLRGWFAQRCVGKAAAIDLAWVRIVACAVLILYIFTEDLESLAQLEPRYYHWPGYLIHLKRGVLKFFVESAPHLRLLTIALLGTLVLGLVGIATRVTIPLATLLYIVYAALLRGFGKYFHDGYLVMYVMIVLSFVPSGDAWSFDAWLRKRRGRPVRAAAYNWMVWACFAALCLPYLQLATSKLANGGLFWFDGRSLRNYMITDDLNLTEWNFDLALQAIRMPTFLWTIAGFFALASELLYPFVLVAPRLRRYLPLCVALLHAGVWFGQDALFLDAILMPLIFLMPSRSQPTSVHADDAPRPRWYDVGAWLRGPAIPVGLVVAMLAINVTTYRVSFAYQWPLEGWQMYAGKTNLSAAVHYRRFVARHPDGRRTQTGLAECAAFLEKPYRLDLGLSRDLPRFLSTCATRIPGADALIYETRTWWYKKRTLAEHLQDPPDYTFTVGLLPAPPGALRTPTQDGQLLSNPDFEQLDAATGVPAFWIPVQEGFVGFGFDPATRNHALLITRTPGTAQVVRQQVTLPAGATGVTASVLARTTTPGAQLAIDVGGVVRAAADIPADGGWHRVAITAAVPEGGTLLVVLTTGGDTYFEDAIMTVADPAGTSPPAR